MTNSERKEIYYLVCFLTLGTIMGSLATATVFLWFRGMALSGGDVPEGVFYVHTTGIGTAIMAAVIVALIGFGVLIERVRRSGTGEG